MADPEVERAAEFFATHAVLLLGLGLAAVALALAAIVGAVRLAARHRSALTRVVGSLVESLRQVEAIRRAVGGTRRFVPTAYLALHLSLGLAAALGIAVFAALAEDILSGGRMAAFDVAFARAIRAGRSDLWFRAFAAVSWFGTREVLTIVTVLAAALLVARRQIALAIGWIAAQAGGGLLTVALKNTFERTRPELADPLLFGSSWSFPSGHAMGTFVLVGVGCYLLVRDSRSWTAVVAAATVSVAWCVVMAFSRLYLGVHFVSDVAAGLVAGAAWVAACVSALEVIRRRGRG